MSRARLLMPLLLALPFAAPAAGAAEWSRSVTVNPEVLASLPAGGRVPALPPRRLAGLGAAPVEVFRGVLTALGPAPGRQGELYAKAPALFFAPGTGWQ